MGVEIVHYKNDLFCIRVYGIGKIFDFFCPINSRPVFPYADIMLSRKWFYKSKDTACAIAGIFRIHFLVIAGTHGERFPYLPQKLVWFFIHADNRTQGVIWKFVDVENIFHTCYEFCIFFWRDAPVVIAVRSKFIFFNTLRMVSLLTGVSSSIRACSSRSRMVHLECPSGAGPQAI